MAETSTTNNKPLIKKAIQSNLAIQSALTAQAAQLEAQLKALDKLIAGVNQEVTTEDVPDAPEGEFQIPGSKRANGPIPSFELLSQESPFYKEASQRAQYLRWTSVRPIKGKEAEILADAVEKENMRLEAYRARDNPATPPIDIMNNVQGINWSIVAEKVSDQSNIKRTPDECRIQWLGNLHPKVNHGNWTQDELNKLHDLTANELATGGKINWARVAKDLETNRIPVDCMKQATTRPRHHWDNFYDQKLREAVQIFGTNNWNLVARHVSPYATTSQCQTRYVRTVDPGIKHGTWSSEEDDRLRKAVAAFGNSWIDVARALSGRTNEQCRERWGEVTSNRSGKGDWSTEEDQTLLDLVKELGNKWKAISATIGGGKTGPHCRLRYDKLIRMRAKQAEEATTPTPGAGPSQVPPASASVSVVPLTTGTAAEAQTYAPTPVSARPKSRRRGKSKAAESSVPDYTTETTSQVTAVQQPAQDQSAESMPPKPRPRPRPRPMYKGKGEEKTANGDIPGEGEASLEQPSTSVTVQPPIENSPVPLGPSTQPRSTQQSEFQAGEVSGSSNVAAMPASTPGPIENQSDVQPALHESVGEAGHPQGQEGRYDITTTARSGRGKRGCDDNIHVKGKTALDKSRHRRSPRKKRKTLVGDGSSQVEAENQENDISGPGQLLVEVENGSPTANGGEVAVDVSTKGRGRGRGTGRGHGRGRGRGRGDSLTVIGEGSVTAAQGEILGQASVGGNQSAFEVPLPLSASVGVDQESVPAEAGGTVRTETALPNTCDKEDCGGQTHVGARGRRGRSRGRGHTGDGSDPIDSPPLRRSSRTGNASMTS